MNHAILLLSILVFAASGAGAVVKHAREYDSIKTARNISCSINAGTATLICGGNSFADKDVGAIVLARGENNSGARVVSRIQTVESPSYVTLENVSAVTIIDGSTTIGLDSTKGIQSMLDDVAAHGGGVALLGGESYVVRSLSINSSATVLDGEGATLLTVYDPFNSQNLINPPVVWVKASNVVLRNLSISYSHAQDGRTRRSWRNGIIEDTAVTIGWSEVDEARGQFHIRDVALEKLHITGANSHGISVGRTNGVSIRYCSIENVAGTGVYGHHSSSLLVSDNTFHNTGDDAVFIDGNGSEQFGPDSLSYDVTVLRNRITKSYAKGIGFGGVSRGVIAENVIIDTWSRGISLEDNGRPPSYISVVGNRIEGTFGNYGSGSNRKANCVFDEAPGVYGAISVRQRGEDTVADVQILNNRLELAPLDGCQRESQAVGLQVWGQGIRAVGNQIIGREFGTAVSGGNQSLIGSFRSLTRATIVGNEIVGFLDAIVLTNASDVSIFGNRIADEQRQRRTLIFLNRTVNTKIIANRVFGNSGLPFVRRGFMVSDVVEQVNEMNGMLID